MKSIYYSLHLLFFMALLAPMSAQHQALFELKKGQVLAQVIPIPGEFPEPDEEIYYAEIRDNLGDFEKWENLHVSIGETSLKYNIDQSKKSATLVFRTDTEGCYSYQIFGKFLHNDGHIYDVRGSGQFYVGAMPVRFDLYAHIDEVGKTADAFFKQMQ